MTTRGRRSGRRLRAPLWSPGRPGVAKREDRRRFWLAIAAGRSSEDAARDGGVSQAVGSRWVPGGRRHATITSGAVGAAAFGAAPVFRRARGDRAAARPGSWRAGDSPGGSVGLARRSRASCAATRPPAAAAWSIGRPTAQWHAERAARRPKAAKLATNDALCRYVEDRLAGRIVHPDGRLLDGPRTVWRKRRHGPRQARRWARAWSPEQISARLGIDFPEDETMRISHEAIYRSLYVQGRGALRRELTTCLRTGRALRVPRARVRGPGQVLRLARGDDLGAPGRGGGSGGAGPLGGGPDPRSAPLGHRHAPWSARRASRSCSISRPTRTRWQSARGPPPACAGAVMGHGAEAVRDAHRRRDHDAARAAAPLAHLGPGGGDGAPRRAARRAWPSGLLLRPQQPVATRHEREHQRTAAASTSPRGTDLAAHGPSELEAVAAALNGRPRKTLGWRTPAEALDELLTTAHDARVATTG